MGNFKVATQLSQIIFAKLEQIDHVSTTQWVDCHIEIAKLEYQNSRIEEAIKILLKIR